MPEMSQLVFRSSASSENCEFSSKTPEHLLGLKDADLHGGCRKGAGEERGGGCKQGRTPKIHFFIINWGFDGRRILKRTIATEMWRALPGRMIPKLLQCRAGFEWIYGNCEFSLCSALGWYLVT